MKTLRLAICAAAIVLSLLCIHNALAMERVVQPKRIMITELQIGDYINYGGKRKIIAEVELTHEWGMDLAKLTVDNPIEILTFTKSTSFVKEAK